MQEQPESESRAPDLSSRFHSGTSNRPSQVLGVNDEDARPLVGVRFFIRGWDCTYYLTVYS